MTWKIKQSDEFVKDLKDVPKEVWDELDDLFKGIKNGSINPTQIGEPIDLKKLEQEEPDVFEKVMKSIKQMEKI